MTRFSAAEPPSHKSALLIALRHCYDADVFGADFEQLFADGGEVFGFRDEAAEPLSLVRVIRALSDHAA